MTTRRGAARGTGRGYRNLRGFPKDPLVHSQSAKGRKQPQRIKKLSIPQSIYVPQIKGWKDTSKTFSDGSKLIEWTSKDKKVNVFDNTQFGSGWVVSATSLKKDEPPQLMSDTNNTKAQAYKKAIKYMQENR